jgi:hypothetical protein
MLYNYYLEPAMGSFQRIFRKDLDRGTVEVADYPTYQNDGPLTRWYEFIADVPARATLIGAGGN